MSNLSFLLNRRSSSVLVEPAPDRVTLEQILSVALTVPDHGRLTPYRFVIVEGAARERFAAALLQVAEDALSAQSDHGVSAREGSSSAESLTEQQKAKIRQKAFAAPLQVVLVFSPRATQKIPEWEQMATASCTGYAITLGAHALGYGAVWKTFAYGSGSALRTLFQLKANESVLGWINLGTPSRMPTASHPQQVGDFMQFLLG